MGCVQTPALSPSAEGVRLLVKAEPESTCRELGDVSTGNDRFMDEGHVKITLRNKAADKGANVATLDVLKQSGNLLGGSGRAFKCPQRRQRMIAGGQRGARAVARRPPSERRGPPEGASLPPARGQRSEGAKKKAPASLRAGCRRLTYGSAQHAASDRILRRVA